MYKLCSACLVNKCDIRHKSISKVNILDNHALVPMHCTYGGGETVLHIPKDIMALDLKDVTEISSQFLDTPNVPTTPKTTRRLSVKLEDAIDLNSYINEPRGMPTPRSLTNSNKTNKSGRSSLSE